MKKSFLVVLLFSTLNLSIMVASRPPQAKEPPLLKVNLISGCDIDDGMSDISPPTNCFIILDSPPKQDFTLTTQPGLIWRTVRSEKIIVWIIINPSKYQPDIVYNFTLSSNKPFFYHQKKRTAVSWKVGTTPSAEYLREIFAEYDPNRIKYPIDLFLPTVDTDDFQIAARNDKDVYEIRLTAPLNAGVNGPPIKEQLKVYYDCISKAKQHALRWIRSYGQNPNELKIKWIYDKY